jgi:superoxide dismutase, Fe-Mn family
MMSKNGGGEPTGDLAKAIASRFGSFGAFKDELSKAALSQFGSGWAWLTIDPSRQLRVEATPNQNSPVTAPNSTQPLLGIDVWEHAYYLKYQNRRADYIAAFFNVINWDFVADRYSKLSA